MAMMRHLFTCCLAMPLYSTSRLENVDVIGRREEAQNLTAPPYDLFFYGLERTPNGCVPTTPICQSVPQPGAISPN